MKKTILLLLLVAATFTGYSLPTDSTKHHEIQYELLSDGSYKFSAGGSEFVTLEFVGDSLNFIYTPMGFDRVALGNCYLQAVAACWADAECRRVCTENPACKAAWIAACLFGWL